MFSRDREARAADLAAADPRGCGRPPCRSAPLPSPSSHRSRRFRSRPASSLRNPVDCVDQTPTVRCPSTPAMATISPAAYLEPKHSSTFAIPRSSRPPCSPSTASSVSPCSASGLLDAEHAPRVQPSGVRALRPLHLLPADVLDVQLSHAEGRCIRSAISKHFVEFVCDEDDRQPCHA